MGNVAKQSDRRSPWAPGHPIFLLLGAALPGLLMIPLYWFQWDREEEMPPRFILLLISLCVMAVASLLWGLWSLWKRQRVSNPVWVAVSAAFAVWLTVGISSLDSFGVSTRMHWLLLCTLSMIPLFCSMAHIVFWLTPRDKAHSIKKTLLPLLALPTVWYLLANTFRYSYGYYANGQDSGSSLTIVLMLAVVFTYCFLFILVRVLYLLARRQSFWRITRAVIVFVLPLLGLLVTQLTPDFSFFWDFSHPIYYILVVLNGILLYLREPENNRLRLLLFSARCATYLFVTYFFVCISPFYTLSLLGILIFGLGLLVLAPVFLWMYQTRLLLESGMELAHRLGKQGLLKIGASALAGLLILPLFLALSVGIDRASVRQAAAYLDGPIADVGQGDRAGINVAAVERSLQYASYGGNRLRFNYYDRYQTRKPPPVLSQVYTKSLAGLLGLGEEPYQSPVYQNMEALYLNQYNAVTGRGGRAYGGDSYSYSDASIIDIRVDTAEEQGYYRSMVHFTIQSNSDWDDLGEFYTSIHLPQGVFVSDYYLDVYGEEKSGLLSERGAALSLYEDIVYTARDPGIVYYNGDALVLRVFPFEAGEIRHTGIEFIHPGPATFFADGVMVELAPDAEEFYQPHETGDGVVYYSAAAKETLPAVQREPHYLLVVDCSKSSHVEYLVESLHSLCESYQIRPEQASVTALNYQMATWDMGDPDWEAGLLKFPQEGGFGLSFAADTLYQGWSDADTYPVMIALTDSLDRAILPTSVDLLAQASPETEGYYVYAHGELTLFPYNQNEGTLYIDDLPDSAAMLQVEVDGQPLFLPQDGQPSVVYGSASGGAAVMDSSWDSALRLFQDYQQIQELPVEERPLAQLALVKNSFQTGILTPLTSYIVLETAEQEAELLARQKAIMDSAELNLTLLDLSSGEYVSDDLDPIPDINPDMAEPSLLLCLLAMVPVALVCRKRRKVPSPSA